MIEGLVVLLIYVLIAGLVYWAGSAIIAAIPGMPPPFVQIAQVILIVIVALLVIYALLGFLGQAPRLRL